MQEEKSLMRKIFRRVYWENLSTILILIGVFMLLQPFAMWMFTYSFIVILVFISSSGNLLIGDLSGKAKFS